MNTEINYNIFLIKKGLIIMSNTEDEVKKSFDLIWPESSRNERAVNWGSINEDLKLKEVLNMMLLEKKYRDNYFEEIKEIRATFTSNPMVIEYRLKIINDLLNNEQLCSVFMEVIPLIEEMNNISNLRVGVARDSDLKKIINRIGELELYVECIDKLNVCL